MNNYIFLLTSMALFLLQLFVYLLIFYILFAIVGYPIKLFVKTIRKIIDRA